MKVDANAAHQQWRENHKRNLLTSTSRRTIMRWKVENSANADFSNLLKMAVDNVNELQQTSGDLKTRMELGDPNVTLEQTMIASQKASIAFEATVQVRNKMVEAYKEIMSMPV